MCSIERALLNFGPCYCCPDVRNYLGWIFVDHAGSDQSSQSFSLDADSSDMTSQELPTPEPASGCRSPALGPEDVPDRCLAQMFPQTHVCFIMCICFIIVMAWAAGEISRIWTQKVARIAALETEVENCPFKCLQSLRSIYTFMSL